MLDTVIIKKKNYLYNNLSNVFCIYLIKLFSLIFVKHSKKLKSIKIKSTN